MDEAPYRALDLYIQLLLIEGLQKLVVSFYYLSLWASSSFLQAYHISSFLVLQI